jgi:hypothetical protein
VVEEARETLGNAIYRALDDEYDHQISAQAVQETLLANACTYLSDGSCFRMPAPA